MLEKALFDGSGRLRTLWRLAAFGAGLLLIQLIVGIIAGIGLVIWLATVEKANVFDDAGLEPLIDEWTLPLMVFSSVPVAALGFGLAALCRRYLDMRPIASMGFVRPVPRASASIWGGLLAGFVPIAGAAAVLWALGGLEPAGVGAEWITVALVPALVLMAFFEELAFRGYLLQNLVDVRRPWFGVLFTSAAFWLVHGMNPHAWESPLIGVNLFGAGIVLALAYLQSGNIWFPTALHFGWNAAQGPALGLPVSGIDVPGLVDLDVTGRLPEWLTGGEFGLEASLAVTFVEVVLIALLWRLWRRHPSRTEPIWIEEFGLPPENVQSPEPADRSTVVDSSLDTRDREDEDRPVGD